MLYKGGEWWGGGGGGIDEIIKQNKKVITCIIVANKLAAVDEEDVNYCLEELSLKQKLHYHLFKGFDEKLNKIKLLLKNTIWRTEWIRKKERKKTWLFIETNK